MIMKMKMKMRWKWIVVRTMIIRWGIISSRIIIRMRWIINCSNLISIIIIIYKFLLEISFSEEGAGIITKNKGILSLWVFFFK